MGFDDMVTDPIANMLTAIRNAQAARKAVARVPYSALKHRVAEVLRAREVVGPVAIAEDGPQKVLEVTLLYEPDGTPKIRGLERVSRPGRRWYVRKSEVERVLSGVGFAVVSTSKGLMTDAEARKQGLGGEVLCKVW